MQWGNNGRVLSLYCVTSHPCCSAVCLLRLEQQFPDPYVDGIQCSWTIRSAWCGSTDKSRAHRAGKRCALSPQESCGYFFPPQKVPFLPPMTCGPDIYLSVKQLRRTHRPVLLQARHKQSLSRTLHRPTTKSHARTPEKEGFQRRKSGNAGAHTQDFEEHWFTDSLPGVPAQASQNPS